MALVQVTAPTTEPVTVHEVKDHLRITTTADDALLRGYIKAARHEAENYMKRQICRATWQLILSDFPNSTAIIKLPRPPLSTASTNLTITYVDSTASGSSSTTVSSTVYHIDTNSEPGRIYPNYGLEWPSSVLDDTPHAVTIQYVSGYSTGNVPEPIKMWIKMRVGMMYEFREPAFTNSRLEQLQEVPRTYFNALLDEFTIMDFAT